MILTTFLTKKKTFLAKRREKIRKEKIKMKVSYSYLVYNCNLRGRGGLSCEMETIILA